MKILLLGSGGREHALAWKIAQSPKLDKLYIAPGNPGMGRLGENVDIKANDFAAIGSFVTDKGIDMVVVGPEVPLVEGIVDYFASEPSLQGVGIIGP
ncbi:MAG TPA: phosphoribosylamine--glycine ligase, partial [Prevotellaceae bacterium]|nr:phosphoribosylamine--glycine ligase [Prevotellaceae bacterium]